MIIVCNRAHARALVEETQTRNAGKPRRGAGFRRFFVFGAEAWFLVSGGDGGSRCFGESRLKARKRR